MKKTRSKKSRDTVPLRHEKTVPVRLFTIVQGFFCRLHRGWGATTTHLEFISLSLHTMETSVADPDPGSGAFLTPGSWDLGWGKNPDPIWDEIEHLGSYFRELRKKIFELKIPKFFDAEPESNLVRQYLEWYTKILSNTVNQG
jgi:hypothetical protein